MNHNILLASFVPETEIDTAINSILKFNVDSKRIFLFTSHTINDIILTYNLNSEFANIKFESIWKDTINIHRKKETNTLFSINAINEIIRRENHGHLNKHHKINWNNYKNKMLLVRNGRLNVVPITFVSQKIYKLGY